jgi:hypothetical protein
MSSLHQLEILYKNISQTKFKDLIKFWKAAQSQDFNQETQKDLMVLEEQMDAVDLLYFLSKKLKTLIKYSHLPCIPKVGLSNRFKNNLVISQICQILVGILNVDQSKD